MEIIKTKNESQLVIELVGRLDTTTAPNFEAVIKNELDGITDLILEFKNLWLFKRFSFLFWISWYIRCIP